MDDLEKCHKICRINHSASRCQHKILFCAFSEQERVIPGGGKVFWHYPKAPLCFSKGCQENVGLRKEEQRFIQREDAPSPRDQKTKSFGQKPSRFPSIVGREGPQEEMDSYHSILLGKKVNFQAFHPFACLPHHQPVCTQLAISLFFLIVQLQKWCFARLNLSPLISYVPGGIADFCF